MKLLLGQYPAGRDDHHREEMKPNHDVANASLRQKLANKEEEIQELQRGLRYTRDLQDLNSRLEKTNDEAISSRNDTVSKLHDVQRRLRYTRDGLSNVNTNLEAEKTKRLKDYSSLEDTKNKEIASLNDKVEKTDNILAEQQDQLILEQKRSLRYNLEAENSALVAEKTKLLKDFSSLDETKNKEIASLNDKVKKQQDQLILEQKRSLRYTNLKAEKSTLVAENTKLLKDYSSLEETKNKEIASLNDKVEMMDKVLVEQKNQLILEHVLQRSIKYTQQGISNEKSALEAEKAKLLKDYSSLEDTKNKEIASLNDKYKILVEQQDQLILEHDMAVSKLTDENRHLKKINSETDFKTQLEKNNIDLALAQKDCEVKRAEIVKLKDEIVKEKAKLDSNQIKVLEMKLVQVDKDGKEKELGDLRKSFKSLETEVEKVKKEKDSLKNVKAKVNHPSRFRGFG
jgi:acetone carboxylase gamma subunit